MVKFKYEQNKRMNLKEFLRKARADILAMRVEPVDNILEKDQEMSAQINEMTQTAKTNE